MTFARDSAESVDASQHGRIVFFTYKVTEWELWESLDGHFEKPKWGEV